MRINFFAMRLKFFIIGLLIVFFLIGFFKRAFAGDIYEPVCIHTASGCLEDYDGAIPVEGCREHSGSAGWTLHFIFDGSIDLGWFDEFGEWVPRICTHYHSVPISFVRDCIPACEGVSADGEIISTCNHETGYCDISGGSGGGGSGSCPEGTYWNYIDRCIKACPGECTNSGGSCAYDSWDCDCPSNMVPAGKGCVIACPGSCVSSGGSCAYNTDVCECPPGYSLIGQLCSQCPSGYSWSSERNVCFKNRITFDPYYSYGLRDFQGGIREMYSRERQRGGYEKLR